MKRSWVEIDLSRVEHNLNVIRRFLLPSTQIIAVVKADAYGHGVAAVARKLNECGIVSFGVADTVEAIELREQLGDAEITVFSGCDPGDEALFQEKDLTAAVFDTRFPETEVKVQVKIDTGMSRLGIRWDRAKDLLQGQDALITGVYSTLSSSDTNPELTQIQLERFLSAIEGMGVRRHLSNSAGLQYENCRLDAVRPGLALYGIASCAALRDLLPILRWKVKILTINEVPEGSTVGYGGNVVVTRQTRIAVLPVGYADGYSRLFSCGGKVLTKAGLAPVIGAVSMDITLVDVTELPGVAVGDEVTLLENELDSPVSASALGRLAGTIPYEVLTSIGNRVERVYV